MYMDILCPLVSSGQTKLSMQTLRGFDVISSRTNTCDGLNNDPASWVVMFLLRVFLTSDTLWLRLDWL